MAIVRRKREQSPFFGSMLPDLFGGEDLFNPMSWPVFGRTNLPAVNVQETDKNIQLELAAPGIPREHIKVHVDANNVLTIEGEQSYESERQEQEGRYTRREFGSTSFQRRFTLPDNVDSKHIEAHCENGVVNVVIPKLSQGRESGRREIKIT